MADPRFFKRAGPFSLKDLADIIHADLVLPETMADNQLFDDVAALSEAEENHVSFLDNKRYIKQFSQTKAGAVIVHPDFQDRRPEHCACLVTKKPYRGYALIAQTFYPENSIDACFHETAIIAENAQIGSSVTIGAYAVIEDGAVIADDVKIGAHAVIGAGVEVGAGTEIGPHASLSYCIVGKAVLIHPGVRIGQRGFGFTMDPEGFVKVPQLGRVIIEDNVEIGANSCIDRGAGPDTVIGAGTMIDNLVQIGHNVQTGRGCVVIAQAGIAGSTKLGNYVVIAAQGGVSGHLALGDGARVAAQGGVMRDIPPGQTVGGSPAVPQRDWLRQSAWLNKMSKKKGPLENG